MNGIVIHKGNILDLKELRSSRENFFLNYYKTEGYTSRYHLNQISRLLNIKKCGYAGTLDPFASGILPIAFNKSTVEITKIHEFEKQYIVVAKFGEKTNTSDINGNVIQKTDFIPNKKDLARTMKIFLGKTIQCPSIYSAVKVNGKRLCDLLRNNSITHEEALQITKTKAKEIEIKHISMDQVDEKRFLFSITCSSGTYIRQLIEDIATNIESLAFVEKLERSFVGEFKKNDSLNYDEIKSSLQKNNIEQYNDSV